MSSPWLVESPAGSSSPRRRLVCFPYAGSGAALYEPWRRRLPGTAISAVRLPGREGRFREPPVTDAAAVARELAPAVTALVSSNPGVPWGVFGYSLGALLAFELVDRLSEAGGPLPAVLLVGGGEPPQVPRVLPDVSWLSDVDFTDALRGLGGTQAEVFDHPELLELLLPMVRADFRILETNPVRPRNAVACPIVTYRGTEDHDIRPEAMRRWSELTSSGCVHRELPGGHFVISERPDEVIDAVAPDLDRYLG